MNGYLLFFQTSITNKTIESPLWIFTFRTVKDKVKYKVKNNATERVEGKVINKDKDKR